jgi:hypothetical protein
MLYTKFSNVNIIRNAGKFFIAVEEIYIMNFYRYRGT